MSRIRQLKGRQGQRSRSARVGRRVDGAAPEDPRAAFLLALQASVGNRATTRAVGRIARIQAQGPEPTPFAPGSPVAGSVLGQTDIIRSTQPSFKVGSEATTAGLRGKVEPTTEGSPTIDARYLTEGLHPMDPAVDGSPRQLLVTTDVASLTKKGEQEHSDDFAWEHSLVFGEAARAINVLSTRPSVDGPDISSIHRSWRSALHDEVSPKLRVEADAADPRKGGSVSAPWFAAKARIHQASLDRDSQQWHSMKIRKPTVAEKEANPVPDGTFLVVTAAGGEIGQHPSEALMRAAFEGLPDRS